MINWSFVVINTIADIMNSKILVTYEIRISDIYSF